MTADPDHDADHRRSLDHRFDLLVLTASDPRQAAIYERSVGRLVDCGVLPVDDLLVVPDPGGRRVGSGGATLEAAARAAEHLFRAGRSDLASIFRNRRVLVVHSGGETRRLPAFAGLGKILLPLPTAGPLGGSLTMLEAIVAESAALPGPPDGQFMVVTGDAVVPLKGTTGVQPDRPGITGVAQRATLERGGRHGVYVADETGRLLDMLQKPGPDEVRRAGGILGDGGEAGEEALLVDTGVLSFDPASIARWLEAAGVTVDSTGPVVGAGLLAAIRAGETGSVELYHELLKAIPRTVPDADFEALVRDAVHAGRAARLRDWRSRVVGMSFHVDVADAEPFLHPGTTSEFIDLVCRGADAAGPIRLDSGRDEIVAARDSVVEASVFSGADVTLRGRNLVSGIPPIRNLEMDLPRGGCVFLIPVNEDGRSRWIAIAHHEHDDFKSRIVDQGTFGGRPMAHPSVRHRLESVAGGPLEVEHTLRELPLWSIGTAAGTLRHAMAVLRGDAVRRGDRISFARALGMLDPDRLLAHRDRLRADAIERAAISILRDRADLSADALASLVSPRQAGRIADVIEEAVSDRADDAASARFAAAGHRFAVRAGRGARDHGMRKALEIVGRSVAGPVEPMSDATTAIVLRDQAVWAASPVRIDFAGGWSDTPPICSDLGGTVVNAAVLLHGKQPIQAMAKIVDAPTINVHSVDLGRSRTFTTTRSLLAPADPSDWTTLPRVALQLAGIVPADPRASLRRRLERFGGGVVLTLYSAVPKGSGLGTSSILGATVLACLRRLVDPTDDPAWIVERTSLLEQMMTTRGGWQDQVGGVYGGIKIARTAPGPRQRPKVEMLEPGRGFVEAIEARSVLVYSGEKRLARDILEKVIGRYLAREPQAIRIVDRLQRGAESMGAAIEAGDVEAFCAGVAAYWTLKRAFDPAATYDRVEAIAATHAADLAAWELPGAGGGGFVLMLARDEAAAARIRHRVDRDPANELVRRFPLEIDREGLRVTVL
ncbi:MAG: hypothetical protein CMJ54_12305 [Planctomycetaceae bacterium]|nr:hypothetical protein [Planctomycetaceae bacterium]